MVRLALGCRQPEKEVQGYANRTLQLKFPVGCHGPTMGKKKMVARLQGEVQVAAPGAMLPSQ